MKNKLTQSRLKEVLKYEPITGEFTWNVSKSWYAKAGEPVGTTPNGVGYLRIGIDGVRHSAHRLAWLYMNGELPEEDIDHINRIRTDNRISNLRSATRSQNLENKLKGSLNSSGYKGVYWHKKAGKWLAQIRANGVHKYLGLFERLEDAATAYGKAASIYHTRNPLAHVESM